MLTRQGLSATGEMPPFPGVPVVVGLWISSMAAFSGPVNVAYSQSVYLGWIFLPLLKVKRDSETRSQRLE